MARPFKPYQTSTGEVIVGLHLDKDGRWRIVETGARFTEPDERRAIAKFNRWKALNDKSNVSIALPLPLPRPATEAELNKDKGTVWASMTTVDDGLKPVGYESVIDNATEAIVSKSGIYSLNEAALWAWVREQLISNPVDVAAKLGIPEIANLSQVKMPKPVKLETLLNNFMDHHKNSRSALAAKSVFEKFLEQTGFEFLADIRTEALIQYRQSVDATQTLSSTKRYWYSRIKGVIKSNIRYGFGDVGEIRKSLDLLQVLYTDEPLPQANPQPISPADFHKLLEVATPKWKAILLLSLNCCLHLGETVSLRWQEFSPNFKTYATIRHKTQKHKIPRCAVLWPETIAALQQVKRPQGVEWVFINSHGSKFNRATTGNLFAELREKAGVSPSVKFDGIRDGAFTAACRCPDGLNLARLLAGHSNGMADSYVLRNPEAVQPACDAVYHHYFQPVDA